jgi:hypothetical protein
MSKLLAALLVFTTLTATAQQSALPPTAPPAGTNWQHVQALPIGTEVYLNAKPRHVVCEIRSTSADTLTCTERAKDIAFERSEISSIKITHAGRSALIGLGVGAGAGAAIGEAGCRGGGGGGLCGSVFGSALGLAGLVIGITTDFFRSTVYKAP